MSSLSPKNILIVKNRAMGDSVMGLSTVSYIKSLYPDAKLYYAIPSWMAPLYKNVEIDADEIVPLDLKNLFGWWKLRKILFNKNIDLIYEMHLSGRTEKFFKLYQKVYKIPYYSHNHHLKSGGKVFEQGKIKALIQRDLDGAWSYLDRDGAYPSYLEFKPKMNLKASSKKQIILGVVATRETKMWPLKHYVELSHLISKSHPETKIVIPLSKSENDLKIQKELETIGLPKQAVFTQDDLSELPITLSGSQLYIGNDTGLKHICVALGIKTYTFFGPEPPLEWHPYSKEEHPYSYVDGLDCRTKTHHYCGLHFCDSMICLNQVTANMTYEKVSEFLK